MQNYSDLTKTSGKTSLVKMKSLGKDLAHQERNATLNVAVKAVCDEWLQWVK